MRDNRFEWDDHKAASNRRKHSVTFELARHVFDDLAAIDEIDDDPDEERWTRIGMAAGRIFFVVYTLRGQRYRIISARKAEPHEEDRYADQDS